VSAFWKALPDHVRTDFPQSDERWMEDDGAFVGRCLELQLEGDVVAPIGTPLEWPHHIPSDPLVRALDYYSHNRRHPSQQELTRYSPRQAVLYSWALARLHRVYVGEDQTEAISAALEEVYLQEVPISRSPGLEGVTLRDLATKGVKAACFFPLITGMYAGSQSLFGAKLLLALQVSGTGAGITLCAISTLWLADKLLARIRHIDPDQPSTAGRRRSRP
jgi:hypothetical protein